MRLAMMAISTVPCDGSPSPMNGRPNSQSHALPSTHTQEMCLLLTPTQLLMYSSCYTCESMWIDGIPVRTFSVFKKPVCSAPTAFCPQTRKPTERCRSVKKEEALQPARCSMEGEGTCRKVRALLDLACKDIPRYACAIVASVAINQTGLLC